MRQQVLEGLNWRIHRIWSTDWFRNPDRELRGAVEAIESAKAYHPLSHQNEGNESPIDRVERSLQQAGYILDIAKYQLANLTVSLRGLELHTVPRATMAAWVTKVVDIESPVHMHEVGRRIANAAGVGRIGTRIQESLLEETR